MGSKNDIELGVLPFFFKHYFRKDFDSKIIKITKRKKNKIIKDRPFLTNAFVKSSFQDILNNTICILKNEEESVYDCLSKIVLHIKDENGKKELKEKKVIYHIMSGKNCNFIKTIYVTNEKQIRKSFCESKELKILNKEEFISN